MSNDADFNKALHRQEQDWARSNRAARRRNLLIWVLAVLSLLFGVFCLYLAMDNAGLAASNRAYGNTQQQEKQNLAAEFEAACKTADFQQTTAGANVCRKAEKVAADPSTPPTGPQGIQGFQGIPGRDGVDGKDGQPGKDSTVPGPAGADSTVPGPQGLPGADSTVPGPQGERGPQGAPGADSTVPGPQGPAGPAGRDGQDGTGPSSFTFTYLGMPYTCSPNPPGSSTYTCSGGTP